MIPVIVVRNELYFKKAFFKATHLKNINIWLTLRDEIENIYNILFTSFFFSDFLNLVFRGMCLGHILNLVFPTMIFTTNNEFIVSDNVFTENNQSIV